MANRCKTVRYCLRNLVQDNGAIGKCWNVTGGGVTWTDETTDINSSGTSDVTPGTAVNDATYFGHARQFCAMTFDMGATLSGGTAVWEYWNGSSWATLTLTSGSTTPADNVTHYWDPPSNWTATTVNSEGDGPWYYIRLRVTGTRSAGAYNAVHVAPLMQFSNAQTIELPETTSRTIRSVSLRLWFEVAVGGTIDHLRLRGRWDSTAYADLTTIWSTTNSWTGWTEKGAGYLDFDITSITSTAWASGTSHTFDGWLAFSGRGNAMATDKKQGVWGELYITYEHDDSVATQLNTIVLPLDSHLGTLSTSLADLGGVASNWPILTGGSGVIKEASPTIKQAYLIFMGNANEAGTTDWSFGVSADAESETVLYTTDGSQQSDPWLAIPWIRNDLSTTSAHSIKVRVSNVTGATFEHVGALLVVTYSYDESSTTTYTHTDVIPMDINNGFLRGTTTDRQVYKQEFWIEGASPTLLQSGVFLAWTQVSDPGSVAVVIGGGSSRSYTASASDCSGPSTAIQRFDSGGAAGAGHTLARGRNILQIEVSIGVSIVAAGPTGIAYITYSYTKESGKRHSTAAFLVAAPANMTAVWRRTGTLQFFIPETNYFIGSIGMEQLELGGSTAEMGRLAVKRGNNLGWFVFAGVTILTDGFQGAHLFHSNVTEAFLRYPGHPDPDSKLLDGTAAHDVALDGSNARKSMMAWVNWHNYTWNVTGDITASAGGTVTIRVYDSTLGTRLGSTSRSGNGAWTFVWYDNTRNVFSEARESGTLLGRSDDGLAGT